MLGGSLSGAAVDSTEVTFRPGDGSWLLPVSGSSSGSAGDAKSADSKSLLVWEADTKTAGSVVLLLQVSLPLLLFLPSLPSTASVSVTLKGGTNAVNAPPVDFTAQVFAPMMHKLFGVHLAIDLVRRGFYPK